MRRLHRILAGTDGPGAPALPAGEFLHPIPLAALAVLGVNDHVLKASGWLPNVITGKLSDAAAFVFFPLLCTAAADTLAWGLARLGVPIDFSLRAWKLAAAIAVTVTLMLAIKLSPVVADAVARTLGAVGFPSRIVCDPTDLMTAPGVIVAWLVGRGELRRVPLGRIEVLARAHARDGRAAVLGLTDVPGSRALAEQLDRYFTTGRAEHAAAVRHALRPLRAR